MARVLFLAALCILGCQLAVARLQIPENVVLNAPFTPFSNDALRSINTSAIPHLAAYAASVGVNTIWVCGSLGQFDTLTVAERKTIAETWITEGHKNGLYMIIHVGSNKLADAKELAAHAAAHDADAIASVPPYYESGSVDVDSLVNRLKMISDSAPKLPLFYYHIPAVTHVELSITELFTKAQGTLPALAGVKYVSSDLSDWLTGFTQFGSTHKFMFAPEPKLAGIPLGGTSVILAEAFYAQTWLRMYKAYQQHDDAGARKEQLWKFSAMAIFSKYGGGYAERYVYRYLLGVDMGPARWPAAPMSAANYSAMIKELEAIDFKNLSGPP